MKLLVPPRLKKSASAAEVLQHLEALVNWVDYNRGWVNKFALDAGAPYEPYIPDMRLYLPQIAELQGRELPVVDVFETWLHGQAVHHFVSMVADKYPEAVDVDTLLRPQQQILVLMTYRAACAIKEALQSFERRELMRVAAGFVPESGPTVYPNADLLKFFQDRVHCESFVSDKGGPIMR